MRMPAELSEKAENLLRQHDYLWDNSLYAFRRARQVGKESTEKYLKAKPKLITFEELTDHGLFAPHATADQKAAALAWLEERVKSN
jgi:hypothetical protein